LLKKFFDPSPPLLTPRDIVTGLTGRKTEELALPKRGIIAFGAGDLNFMVRHAKGALVDAWAPFKQLYRFEGSDTIIARSFLGGPAVAALVEELSAFGVEELIMWGYCGALDDNLKLGDMVIARGALREDGVSYHYSEDENPVVYSNWWEAWSPEAGERGFREGIIWSCDAIYRETAAKVARYRDMGITAVEMEAASFYSVSKHKGVKGIVFLVVSDLLTRGKWQGGFRTKAFKDGAKNLSRFMLEKAIL
jgi:uridine phosphorylase